MTTDAEILARLQEPLVPPPAPADNSFRLGIVLNGTVAAGAWTAGVLDALVQVLDAWEAEKAAGGQVPRHSVRIDVLGGASGGGVCAALLARAASRRFPHVADAAGNAANPFWQVWVEALRIEDMLTRDDLADPAAPAASALDGRAIERGLQAILDWGIGTPGVTPLAQPRRWLADPLHVAVTLTNLRGVPYGIAFEPSGPAGAPRQSYYVGHADHALFAFPARAGGAAPAGLRGDAMIVGPDFVAAEEDWERFARFVRATGAFPVGFPPVRLARPVEHYRWRAAMVPGGRREGMELPAVPRLLRPAWEALPPAHRPQPGGSYLFDCVDGGALNNQPVELVRTGLAGLGGRLERDGAAASAAVLLIDPFAAAPECPAPAAAPDLLHVGLGLASAWKNHARFATSDLLLALDGDVFSRFLLTAGRKDQAEKQHWGGAAVAGAGFGAFLGFLDRRYRVHDFLLGRKNCLDWLLKHFKLPATNPLFAGIDPEVAGDYGTGDGMLPIIPVVPPLRASPPPPAWPEIAGPGSRIEDALAERLEAVIRRLGLLSGLPCNALIADGLGDWAGAYARRAIDEEAAAQARRS